MQSFANSQALPHATNDVCALADGRCGGAHTSQWGTYEAAKRAWMAANEQATSCEYEAAIRGITERLGL